ncbi:MAG: RNA polymerase sigma factor RpoE, partial [uncultured Actinomycetospora sp.]
DTPPAGGAGRGAVHRRDRAVPPGAAGALLPHGRLGARRRGPGAGDLPAGVARVRRVRGSGVDPDVAPPDRHQRLPHGPRAAADPGAALGSGGTLRRAPTGTRDTGRGRLARTAAGHVDRPVRRGPDCRRPGRGGGRPRVAAARAHRRPAAPARPPARDPRPARRARVLRGRDRGVPRHHHRGGQERAAAGSRPAGGAGPGVRRPARPDGPAGASPARRLHHGVRALRRPPAGTGAARRRHAGGHAVPRLAGGPGEVPPRARRVRAGHAGRLADAPDDGQRSAGGGGVPPGRRGRAPRGRGCRPGRHRHRRLPRRQVPRPRAGHGLRLPGRHRPL